MSTDPTAMGAARPLDARAAEARRVKEGSSPKEGVRNWSVGHNMPGYMPEGEPYIFANWEDAREALTNDLEQASEAEAQAGNTEAVKAAEAAAMEVRLARPDTEYLGHVGDYAYWINATDEPADDADGSQGPAAGPASGHGAGPLVEADFAWDAGDHPEIIFHGWHDPHDRWNGAATPAFEKGEADRLAAYTQAHPEHSEVVTYDSEVDGYWVRNPLEPESRSMLHGNSGELVRGYDRDGHHLYGIGAYAWTWMEVPKGEAGTGTDPQRYLILQVDYSVRPGAEGTGPRMRLDWIAPELEGAQMSLTTDEAGPEGSWERVWSGLVSEDTYQRLAKNWSLDEADSEPNLGILTEYGHLESLHFDFDGMDWNVGGITPIIHATLRVSPPLVPA